MILTPDEIELSNHIFITKKSIADLDIALDKIYSYIRNAEIEEIKIKIEEGLVYYRNKDESNNDHKERIMLKEESKFEKKAIFEFTDDSQLIKNNAMCLIKDISMRSRYPKSLIYIIKIGHKEFYLRINANYGKCLRYRTSNVDEDLKTTVFQEIELWLDKYKSNPAISFWTKSKNSILLIATFLCYGLFLRLNILERDSYSSILKKEMNALLKADVLNQDQINDLIILMAKLQSKYIPENFKIIDSSFYYYIITLVSLIGIIGFFAPKTTIEYGKSEIWVKIWRYWSYLILIFLPGAIIIPNLFDFFR
jgi:hypothetical protein